ncbi:MAG TPA: nitrilase family protein [Candidatus Coprenecus stercoravium]|uniref:Nitrilase family protein n=1 Tax=Candidatus Coprenecus stercoravium TaxID=2840735 RepID=A0A9D2GPM4_9BACT|nr:nitrilase family protein [Candidatus Coprenecus stercoravium]
MKDLLNIALCQYSIQWEAPSGNMGRLSAMIDSFVRTRSADTVPDLIVLPEFFATGFTQDLRFAEPPEGPVLQWMKDVAGHTGAAVAGSTPVMDGGCVRNRFYFVWPDGRYDYYDKRHLFRMSAENEVFTPGTRRRTVEYLGWRIGLNVCYDLRFPVWSRNTQGNSYDIMLNVASWPASRIETASLLVRARAVENQAWMVFCNREGESPDETYSGGSMIVDYTGRSVGVCEQGFLTASADIAGLREFRESFPVWKDADIFEI